MEFICPEKAPLFRVHWEVYRPAPTGRPTWVLQLRGLECFIHLAQGPLRHHNVLCCQAKRLEVEGPLVCVFWHTPCSGHSGICSNWSPVQLKATVQ